MSPGVSSGQMARYRLEVGVGMIASIMSAVFIVLLNKTLFATYGFSFPVTLTGWHLCFTAGTLWAACRMVSRAARSLAVPSLESSTAAIVASLFVFLSRAAELAACSRATRVTNVPRAFASYLHVKERTRRHFPIHGGCDPLTDVRSCARVETDQR